MRRVLISLALLLVCGAGTAGDHIESRQFIHDQLQVDHQCFRTLQTPEFLQWQRSAGAGNQAFLDTQASRLCQSMQPGECPADAALIFVSSSMPPDELRQRVRDAAELNVPVATRGMVNDDTRVTANAVAGLIKESSTGDMQIDPTTFRKYNITAVPVLVVACGNQGNTADRPQGDLALHQALKRVTEVGNCANTARNLLREEVQ